MKIENSIDIVITWVDGNDPEWRSEKNKKDTEKSNCRRQMTEKNVSGIGRI